MPETGPIDSMYLWIVPCYDLSAAHGRYSEDLSARTYFVCCFVHSSLPGPITSMVGSSGLIFHRIRDVPISTWWMKTCSQSAFANAPRSDSMSTTVRGSLPVPSLWQP